MTLETIPVKTWGGFNLTILKVNLNPLWKNQSFTIGLRPLTSYCYPPVETYWHNHVQALRLWTPLFLDSEKHKHPRLWLWDPTQRLSNTNSPVCDFKTTFKCLDHQRLWWLEKATTSTTPNLEILQVIIPVEDIRKLLGTKP